MPCLLIKTNHLISEQKKEDFCLSTSEKMANLLGKPETYIMTILEDQVSMTMSGSTEPTAYIELKSINLPEEQTSTLSRALCEHIGGSLNIDSSRIYIEFSNAQRHLWGWNGKTF